MQRHVVIIMVTAGARLPTAREREPAPTQRIATVARSVPDAQIADSATRIGLGAWRGDGRWIEHAVARLVAAR